MQQENINIMHCDPETGLCAVPQSGELPKEKQVQKPVKLLYFTDPICSSCWGIEPQLRRLKQEYGDHFDIEYRMGGLLKSWDSYGGRDVSGPASVAQHWNEAAQHYNMPIDGSLWLDDPLDSSFPPSIAFKAAQLQGTQKSERFLRRLKEMVFVEKKNITRWEHLSAAALDADLELVQFTADYNGKAKDLFNEDLQLAKQWGVRGFPTIFFLDAEENQLKVYGSKPYENYERALLMLVPGATKKAPTPFEAIFDRYESLTTREFAELYNRTLPESELTLAYLQGQQKVAKITTPAGVLWRRLQPQGAGVAS